MLFHDWGAGQLGPLFIVPMSARPQVFHCLPLPRLPLHPASPICLTSVGFRAQVHGKQKTQSLFSA